MSNYVQTTFFTPKDSLPPTNPAKTIFGAAYDVEFGNIATAISTKLDSSTSFIVAVNGTANQIVANNSSGTVTLALTPNVTISSTAGASLVLNSTAANGAYMTFARSGTSVADIGNAAQIFSGGTVDNLGIAARAGFGLDMGANGNKMLSLSSTGNLVLATPSSGVAFTFPSAASSTNMIGANMSFGIGSAFSAGQSEIFTTSTNRLGIGTAGAAVLNFYTGSAIAGFFDTSQNLNINNGTGQSPVYAGIPQNAQGGNYTLVLADANKHILSTNSGAVTITIPANASVAFPVGTAITFVNKGSTSLAIAITSDTLVIAGTTTTGTRTLNANSGCATAIKVSSTLWIIQGGGLT